MIRSRVPVPPEQPSSAHRHPGHAGAMSVPDISRIIQKTAEPYAMSVPDIAKEASDSHSKAVPLTAQSMAKASFLEQHAQKGVFLAPRVPGRTFGWTPFIVIQKLAAHLVPLSTSQPAERPRGHVTRPVRYPADHVTAGVDDVTVGVERKSHG
eukprot:3395694-Rhodomonas_salina.1